MRAKLTMSMTNLQGIICWAHARYFFTFHEDGCALKPSQPTEVLSIKNTHWLSKQTLRADHESRTRRKTANQKREFYRLKWNEDSVKSPNVMRCLWGSDFLFDNLRDEHGAKVLSERRRSRRARQSSRPIAVSSPKRSSLTLNPPSNNSARSRRTSCVNIGSRGRSLWCLAEGEKGGTS